MTGLMLTTDENILDIDFQVVWNINDPAAFLFNLSDGPHNRACRIGIRDARDCRRKRACAAVEPRSRCPLPNVLKS